MDGGACKASSWDDEYSLLSPFLLRTITLCHELQPSSDRYSEIAKDPLSSRFLMEPLSRSRPRRSSAADTAAAIARSLEEEAKPTRTRVEEVRAALPAPSSKAAGKRKAESTSSTKPKMPKTPSESFSVLKSGLPKSSKTALAKADAADLAAIRGADLKKALTAHVKSLAHTVDAVRLKH